MRHVERRLATAILCGVVALVGIAPTVAAAASTTCRVHDVTQGTHGTSLRTMVIAALDGDHLTVRGTCRSRAVFVGRDITIRGVGERRAVLDADGRRTVLGVRKGARVILRHLAITGGRSTTRVAHDGSLRGGGGIMNRGTLTLIDAVVRGNAAVDGREFVGLGGGLFNLGTLRLDRSVVRGNTTTGSGGGISNDLTGTLTMIDSVVRDNTARDQGGGIESWGTVTLVRSVVAGNARGGIWTQGTATLTRTLVARNHGGGILNQCESGTCPLTLIDSVVRANTARYGGGIQNAGTATIIGSVVRANRAGTGGGIVNSNSFGRVGTMVVRGGSSIIGNVARHDGGGIVNLGGSLTLRGSTLVEANTAGRHGGGIVNSGTLTLRRSTVTANTAATSGGGIWNDDDPDYGGTVIRLAGSSVTGNAPDDCHGTPAC